MPLRGKDEMKRRIRRNGNALARGTLLEAHRRLVMGTPVDEGRARGNWNVGVDDIDRTVDPDRLDPSGRQSLQRGQSIILGEFRIGDVAYVTNSLPYIQELEDGSSQQAPEGWVKLVAAQMRRFVSRVLGRIASGQ